MNFRFTDHVNVRAGPSTDTSKVAQYHPGETVRLDKVSYDPDDGKRWGSYIGRSGERRYVCLGDYNESYGYGY